jgi:hypothetical protein
MDKKVEGAWLRYVRRLTPDEKFVEMMAHMVRSRGVFTYSIPHDLGLAPERCLFIHRHATDRCVTTLIEADLERIDTLVSALQTEHGPTC